MTEETTISAESQDVLKIKHPEPGVSRDEPWQDDVLDRAKIAEKLTNLFREQRDPFVISIDGQWGTGKTFLLERWQRDLEREGFSAIYFNAWEDDFCDDPLLAIIGQLSEQFRKGKFKELAEQVGQITVQLIKQNLIAVPSKMTGLDLSVDVSKLADRDLLQEYSDQRKTKVRLKNKLTQLSAKVVEESGSPLVFIIDELDRCRPTFAIELLERVKHIFDIPNIVFVFGVNRDELCKSLQSIYGDIDADVYLRRFFDLEFLLPTVDSEQFCRSMMARFGLGEYFRVLSERAKTNLHADDYRNLSEGFPVLCNSLSFSLRDIAHCVSLIALAGRNLSENQLMFPWLLGLLIPLKFRNPEMFRQFVSGERRASEVMDYLDEVGSLPSGVSDFDDCLTVMEAYLYLSERQDSNSFGELPVLAQLKLLHQGSELTHPEILSKRIRVADRGKIDMLIRIIESEVGPRLRHGMLDHLAGLIDLHQLLRR